MSVHPLSETTYIVHNNDVERRRKEEIFKKISAIVAGISMFGGCWALGCNFADCTGINANSSYCKICPAENKGVLYVFMILGCLGILLITFRNQIHKKFTQL